MKGFLPERLSRVEIDGKRWKFCSYSAEKGNKKSKADLKWFSPIAGGVMAGSVGLAVISLMSTLKGQRFMKNLEALISFVGPSLSALS